MLLQDGIFALQQHVSFASAAAEAGSPKYKI